MDDVDAADLDEFPTEHELGREGSPPVLRPADTLDWGTDDPPLMQSLAPARWYRRPGPLVGGGVVLGAALALAVGAGWYPKGWPLPVEKSDSGRAVSARPNGTATAVPSEFRGTTTSGAETAGNAGMVSSAARVTDSAPGPRQPTRGSA